MANEEKVSTKTTLRFLELNIESYAGINKDKDSSLCIVFPEDKRIMGAHGNQGTGKTSLLAAILSLAGNAEPDNAENATSKTKKASWKFVLNDIEYTTNLTKSAFTLSMKSKDGVVSKLTSPKENLLKLLGSPNVNPQDLKHMDGKKQIAWIRSLCKWTPEQQKKEETLKDGRKKAYDARTETNRNIKEAKTLLLQSGYFKEDEENKCLVANEKMNQDYEVVNAASTDEKALKEKFANATKKKETLQAAKQRMETLLFSKTTSETDIIELKNKLAAAESTLVTINENIEKGKSFIEENKNAAAEFEVIQKEVMEFGNIQILKDKLSSADKRYTSLDGLDQEKINLDGVIDGLDNQIKQQVQMSLPDVPGLEIVIGAIDSSREEGLYFRGKTMAMLSESEISEMYIPVMEETGSRIIVIENITSYGSHVIETLNKLAKEKGFYIFFSAMKRQEDTMKVEFYEEIE